MAKKQVDPLKARQKKQKILLAVLGVVFLGLVAFEVPKVMKKLHPAPPVRPSASASTTPAPAGTPTLAAPSLGGAQSPGLTTPSSTGSLAAAPAPTVQDGQLTSFSRFASKDPFAQQLSDTNSSSSPSSSSGSSGRGAAAPTVPTVRGNAPAPGSAVITKTRPQVKRPNMYRVLLLNDDYTPMEFVVDVLQRFFNKDRDAATRIMLHVHHHGIANAACILTRSPRPR